MDSSILGSDDAQDYIRELRTWRERRGMTKKALAEAITYDPSRISHIEAGRQRPTEQFTRQVDAALQTGGALWQIWERLAGERLGVSRPVERELRVADLVAWLARHTPERGFQEIYGAVSSAVDQLETEPPSARYAREHDRRLVDRAQIADALIQYYSASAGSEGHFYRAQVGDDDVVTSVLTRSEWVDVAVPLGQGERISFVPPPDTPHDRFQRGPALNAAIRRLASVEVNGTVMVNNPLYRLLDVNLSSDLLTGTLTTVDFAHHALTSELMEGELLDALVSGQVGHLPLREAYLPTAADAFDLASRACVGGPVSLLAIARRLPDGERDYVLLAQERSSSVLNAAGAIGLIPKAFHQPTGEPTGETRLLSTVRREFEEELLGRADLEQIAMDEHSAIDPLHAHNLTEPMAWLLEQPDSFRAECTGLGFNMVTSNFEFSCLLVVEDETWWERFGGEVATNWEAVRVLRTSTQDTAGIQALVHEPRWGNESLFALIQGLHRLSEVGDPERLALPTITPQA